MTPAYGQIGTVERTFGTVYASHRFTYELSGSLYAGYFKNESRAGQFAATPLNFQTWYAGPSLRYEFNKDMFLEGSYMFTRLTNYEAGTTTAGSEVTTTATRSQVMVRFFIQHAIME